MPRPSAASGVGEVGLEVRDGEVLVTGAVPGGASPEERMGSEDPVSKEAAVAAAATLKSVPRTSMLLEEIVGTRSASGSVVDGCGGETEDESAAGSFISGVVRAVSTDVPDSGVDGVGESLGAALGRRRVESLFLVLLELLSVFVVGGGARLLLFSAG